MKIGKFKHNINVSYEFLELSKNDENAAYLLAEKGYFRQACYFLIQAMEKAIRAKIFLLVNPNNAHFREKNMTHSFDSAVKVLIEIMSKNDFLLKKQVSEQIKKHVLGDTRYKYLHNNLRYPKYSEKYNSYSIMEIKKSDFDLLTKRLNLLRKFLDDLYKFT